MDIIDPFRRHIDELLSSYVQAHLVKDHIEYTYNIFNLLKPYVLRPVPLADPTAFTIPLEPFDSFFRLHHLDQLPRYEERFKASPEATQLLKQHLRMRPGSLKTERIVRVNDYGPLAIEEPLFPAFTRRSLRTGRFTKKPFAASPGLTSCNALINDVGLKPVETVDVPEPAVPYQQTLKVLWFLALEEREEVYNILKHVSDMRRPQPNHKNSSLHAFLHVDVSLPDVLIPEEEFTPIFPRNRRICQESLRNTHLSQGCKELADVLPEAVMGSDDSEINFMKTTLEVVDGWETLKISSPVSPATPTTSQEEDRIDQLFLEDSPPTEPTIGLMDEKMDEIELPRSRRIGGSHGRKEHILHGQTLATFLPSLVQKGMEKSLIHVESKDSSPEPESLLGQPSVDTNTATENDGVSTDDDWKDLNVDIARLCPNEDPVDVIMKTKLENDFDTFIEVPQLPPPTDHTSSFMLPTKLRDLIRDPEGQSDRRPLKNSKGLPALRLSLSWVTFTSDSPLPPHEEVCGVVSLLPPSMIVREQVDQLLRRALEDDSSSTQTRKRMSILDDDIDLPPISDEDSYPLIAISRTSRCIEHKEQVISPVKADKRAASESDTLAAISSPRRPKRFRSEPEPEYPLHDEIDSVAPLLYPGAETGQFDQSDEFEYEPSSDSLCLSSIDTTFVNQQYADYNPADIKADLEPSGKLETDSAQLHKPGVDHTSNQIYQPDSAIVDLFAAAVWPPMETTDSGIEQHISHLATFTRLRAKALKEDSMTQTPAEAPPISLSPTTQDSTSDNIAAITVDKSTLSLPDYDYGSGLPHRYMASMELLQRQTIIRELRKCGIDLAERDTLGGVELIVDPFSAVLVNSMFTLPAFGKQLVDRISEHSWRFQHLLILLEGYPQTLALRPPKSKSDIPEVSAYTPPILKAIKKLRRDVTVAEACGKKNSGCTVQYSFVNSTLDAGRIIRYFGDLAEARDQTGGILWQPRDWLDDEVSVDEEDLSKLDGMNRMSATILLCKASADEILDMLPEERMEHFGLLIGADAVNSLNSDLRKRFNAIDTSDDTMNHTQSWMNVNDHSSPQSVTYTRLHA
ncbi:hypothetical protein AN958_08115 [Leucoagaricus sp. SymC.cos]|nr:hypothetical protein AN958_08115 [Leucoagaricus sp. SymC.cos]